MLIYLDYPSISSNVGPTLDRTKYVGRYSNSKQSLLTLASNVNRAIMSPQIYQCDEEVDFRMNRWKGRKGELDFRTNKELGPVSWPWYGLEFMTSKIEPRQPSHLITMIRRDNKELSRDPIKYE